jgi:hypothetical protein
MHSDSSSLVHESYFRLRYFRHAAMKHETPVVRVRSVSGCGLLSPLVQLARIL